MNTGAPFTLWDLFDLLVLKAARIRRRARAGADADLEFYEEFFTDHDDKALGDAGDPRKNVRLEEVVNAIAEFVPQGSILDVGCGVGDTLLLLKQRGAWKLTGIEYAQSTVDRAQRRIGAAATIAKCSALEMPFLDAKFDGFVCVEVLEHIEDDEAAMREIRRVLMPGGHGVITLPYRFWFPQYLPLIGHHRHYSRTFLEQRLRRNGFEVVRWLHNYPRWHRAADFSYVLARGLSVIQSRLSGRMVGAHEARLPLAKRPLYTQLIQAIDGMRERDAFRAPEELITTASCVVRRAD